jgi:hypothetical protein
MTKINLLKRKGKKAMTLDEFKAWLNKLIADKKGALPDLHDWKNIKENLDKVKIGSIQHDLDFDGSGYTIMEPVHDADPADYTINFLGYDMSMLQQLEDLEYYMTKVETATAVPKDYTNFEVTYNGIKVTLENTYEAKENESHLNRDCRGK